MSGGGPEDRLDTFREAWKDHTEGFAPSPQHRRTLEGNMELLSSRLTQPIYGPQDVIQCADEIEDGLSDSHTRHLEAASSTSVQDLIDEIASAAEDDREAEVDKSEVDQIIRDHIDRDGLEDEIESSGYDVQTMRSKLFGGVSETSLLLAKKSLSLYDLAERTQSCASELSSSSFRSRYHGELADSIQSYLQEGTEDVPIDDVVAESVDEFYYGGWDDDSFSEAIDVLESTDDVDEFCGLLRGTGYAREYCVPLPGGSNELPAPQMSVGGVEFFMKGCDDFTYLDDFVELDERTEEDAARISEQTNLFAVLNVTAPTKETGEKKMQNKLERSIDALNYSKKKGVLQSPFTQLKTTYICRVSDGSWNIQTSWHNKYAIPLSFRFGENVDVIQDWFEFMAADDSDLTQLEKRFINSYRWYGDGIQSGIPEEEFLKYMISIESMVVPEEYGGKKYLIADRLADLLGIYDEFRDSFKNEIISLYDTRSRLVHNADFDVSELDDKVATARQRASDMFGSLIENYLEDYDDLDALLADVDELVVPEKPDDWSPI